MIKPLFVLVALSCVACHSPSQPHGRWSDGGVRVTDSRDGKVYAVYSTSVYVWLASNLRYDMVEAWCDTGANRKCTLFGRMYSHRAALKEPCPPGWHLPSRDEWIALIETAGGYLDFPETRVVGNPQASYAALTGAPFRAVLGGAYTGGGRYSDRSPLDGFGDGMYWTSSRCGSDKAWIVVFNSDSKRVLLDCAVLEGYAMAIRCVRRQA